MTNPVNTGFTLPPKFYDFLKWFSLVALPAVTTLILGLGIVLNWGGAVVTGGILALVDTFLGSLVKQSSSNAAQQQVLGNLVMSVDNDGNAVMKRIEGTQENPTFEVGSQVKLNVTREHPLQ